MKKIFATLFFAAMFIGVASAQDYNRAIGVRLGGSGSITYQQSIGGVRAIEAMVDFSFIGNVTGINAVVLHEWNTPVIADGFNLYYGVGAHIGVWNSSFALGIDGIVGLEYKFPSIPLALSLDFKPALNVIPEVTGLWGSFGLGVKYTF